MKHLWTIEWVALKYQQKVSWLLKKLIKGEEISIQDSGLSKREWNELMEAFNLNDKMI